MTSLLVMVPVRNRPEKIPGLIESYEKNTTRDDTELMFISDGDDDSYQDTDWGSHVHAVLDPREYVVGKMNKTALAAVDAYDAIMFAQDDNLFVTPGWDDIMLKVLEGMGGTGMLYPDDKRRQDIPEIIMISTDIIRSWAGSRAPSWGTTTPITSGPIWAGVRGCCGSSPRRSWSTTTTR